MADNNAPDDAPDDADPFAPTAPLADSVRALAAEGLTDAEIADRLGIDATRAAALAADRPDWNAAHDARVMRALYAAAVGARSITERLDRLGDVRRLVADAAPDARAALAWLQARQREQWAREETRTVRVIVERKVDGIAPRIIEHDAEAASDETVNYMLPSALDR